MKPAAPSLPKALHVGVIRGGKFIDDRYITAGGSVTVGEAEGNTFPLPLSALPESHSLFQRKSGGYALVFTEAMRGRVAVAGREVGLEEARAKGLARRSGGHYELELTAESKGRVTLGDITFVFNFGPPPPEPPKPALPPEARGTVFNIVDHTFTVILIISLVAHLGFVGAVSRRVLPPEDLGVQMIPDRYAKLLVPEKPIEEEKPPPEEKKEEEALAKDEKKEEKKEDKKPEEPAEAKDSVEHKKKVQDAIESTPMLRVVKSAGAGVGGGALAAAFAPTGISDDIGAAMLAAKGSKLATSADGEPSRRGEGAAAAANIGDLATSGGKAGGLKEKKDVEVKGSVSADEDAEVDSPGVDKEAVAKFIKLRLRSVQGCYEQQLKRSPTLRGKLVIRFVIDTLGRVAEVSVVQDTMGNDAVESCVMRIVKTWRLPFKPESDTPVSFPFLFQPG